MRDQYNITADVILNQPKPLNPQKLNSKRLNFMNQNQKTNPRNPND